MIIAAKKDSAAKKGFVKSRLHSSFFYSHAQRASGGTCSDMVGMKLPGGVTILPNIRTKYKQITHVRTIVIFANRQN
jgi:hypothetical protein